MELNTEEKNSMDVDACDEKEDDDSTEKQGHK